MLFFNLDKKSKVALYKQIFLNIRRLIADDTLKAGDRLPSSRQLAVQLGVNRTTVTRAYEELWVEGYLESKSGSYSTIRKRPDLLLGMKNDETVKVDWSAKLNPLILKTYNEVDKVKKPESEGKSISFLDLSPDKNLMPVEDFRKVLNKTLLYQADDALTYGDPKGYQALRKVLAKQMKKHGIPVSEKEILITNGAQEGLDILVRALVKPGECIFVESPTYSAAIRMFNFYGINIIEIPMKEDGMDLIVLEQQLKMHNPAFIYVMPNFHNPTGITTSQKNREQLLKIAGLYNTPIIEDGFEEELKYFGKVTTPIKSMDKRDLVLYLGTISKVLFPGLRLGWIACSEDLIDKLTTVKSITNICSNYLTQVALTRFITEGNYDLHLRRLHKIYRKRMSCALSCLKKYFTEEYVKFTNPKGGYLIWGQLCNKTISEEDLIRAASENNVLITPGLKSFKSYQGNACFRLSIAHLNEEQISEGLLRLSQTINQLNLKS